MNKIRLNIKSLSITLFGFLIFIVLTLNQEQAVAQPDIKAIPDSLKILVEQCSTDTARFEILKNYFWQYANDDLNRVKTIGEWAFSEIAHTQNLKALSEGYDIKGFILKNENKLDSAYQFYLKALTISKRIGYHSRTSWCYYHLATINNTLGNRDSALIYFKLLYQFDLDNKFHTSVCEVLTEIGNLYGQIGQNDSALLFLENALQSSIKLNYRVGESNAYFALINFYERTNNTTKKIATINDALTRAVNANDVKTVFNLYFTIADLFFRKKNYDIALKYYNKILEESRFESNEIKAIVRNSIGNVYFDQGNDSLALIYTEEALKLADEIKFRHQVSESYRTLGKIKQRENKFSEAIANYKISFETGCDRCARIVFHSSLLGIADSYLKLSNREKALEYYNKSLELAKEFNAKPELALSNLKIGNYYRTQNGNLSENYYLNAIKISGQTRNFVLIKSVADNLSRYYLERNNISVAYEYLALSQNMADSIALIDRQTSMDNWTTRFEFEKLNNENEAKKAEIGKQKLYRNGAFIISGLLVIMGFFFYMGYRRKKRDNRILTDQKLLIDKKNQEIQSQIDEISLQKSEIERISTELHESDEMKLRFFANVSHELRTPLTLILNPAKRLLESGSFDSENKKQIDFILSNAQKLHDLTNQIMDLQKLDAGELKLSPEKADFVTYCLGVASSFESLCDKKGNSIRFKAGHRSIVFDFDKDKVGKILANLLSNAFKFCYENTTIEVAIKLTDHQLLLVISDAGIGIEQSQIDNVFKPYYQAPSNNRNEGTGIGLAYVKELVGQMHGTVSLTSTVNVGTKVTVSIPLNSFETAGKSKFEMAIPKPKNWVVENEFTAPVIMNGDQKSILIVEDNDELRSFIADLFTSEYNLCTASDGLSGVQSAFENLPDIIISDVMMPQMDGFELCSLLKKDERTSHIPIILLTAKDNSQSNLDGYLTGADDYLVKPFDNELLKLKVRNILSTHDAARKQFDFKSILSVENLKLGNTDKDFMRKCLAVVEKNIANTEFDVDQLASELAFSNRNFYRKINSITNQTPAELIRIYRLHYAKKLLQSSKMRVFEIAEAVGYEDVKRFSQAFKKQFDLLPSELAGGGSSSN